MQYVSLTAFALVGAIAIAFGIRYLRKREFMPYHAQVVGQPWSALEPRVQTIILGMFKVTAGGLLGSGCAILWLLLPLRQGQAWAALASTTTTLAVTIPILYVVLWLRTKSPGAQTPVAPTVVALALGIVGGIAFFAGNA